MAALDIVSFPDEPAAFDIEADDGYVVADHVAGDTFPNDGKTALYVNNGTGGPITVTAVAARRCNHGTLHNAAIAVPAGFAGFVAMEFEADRFNADGNVVSLTYSGAGLSVAAVRRAK